eukprot:640228-Rhodomonas_salina.3
MPSSSHESLESSSVTSMLPLWPMSGAREWGRRMGGARIADPSRQSDRGRERKREGGGTGSRRCRRG